MSERTLTAAQQGRLRQRLSRTRDARVYRRLLAVLEVGQGRSISSVARQLGVARQSVHNWLDRYQQGRDPQRLRDAQRTGRPTVWSDRLQEALDGALGHVPSDLGYTATAWTVPLLQHHLEAQTGCLPSDSSLRRQLEQLGYVWKRFQYVLPPDPEREKKTSDSPKTRRFACSERGLVRG